MPKQKQKYTPRSKELVYYGPHPCAKGCGKLVVTTGSFWNGKKHIPAQVEYTFDAPHDIVYPNHVYTRHQCEGLVTLQKKNLGCPPSSPHPYAPRI